MWYSGTIEIEKDMLSLWEMLFRLGAAIVLGAIVGLERESIGKEAGIRTNIMVAAGSALFTIAAVAAPYLIALSPENLAEVLARNSGFLAIAANVVVGIGFLGAGIIVKQGTHVRSLTTAATVWFVAAIGMLCGFGLILFAALAAIILTALLFILRNVDVDRFLKHSGTAEESK